VLNGLGSCKKTRKALNLGEENLNYYDKSFMAEFLIQSKNGCLNSEIDVLTYLSHPVMVLILKRIYLETQNKLSFACKLIYGTLDLSNVNWIATKNVLLFKNWLRVADSSLSEKNLIDYLVQNSDFTSQRQIVDIFLGALQSPYPNIRNHILSILWDA